MTYHISGHLDLTEEEFRKHYVPLIEKAIADGASFFVGDARGADTMAQKYLASRKVTAVTVFHMLEKPRNNVGYPTQGGYPNDESRDFAMFQHSQDDIAWVRLGREDSGTANNLKRRTAFKAGLPNKVREVRSDGRKVK